MAKKKKKQVSKLSGQSLDIKAGQVEKLKSLFPQVVKDGEIDFGALKLALGSETDTNGLSYGLSWAGKADCFRHIQQTTTATLRPIRGESVDFDNTENIFIEGDNLEVLKVLRKNYYGKVKMIYIDPPYNTGNDSFIYPDRFKEEKADYEERAGIKDAEGLLTKDGFFRKNSKDTGHFHSNWLCMIYPRLFLAKNLLREDGVIFVSIDDNEVHNLRMIMNEIFGEENFIAQIMPISNPGGRDYNQIAVTHEYLLVYAKTDDMELNEIEKIVDFRFYDKKEGYNLRELRNRNPKFHSSNRPNLFYPFYINPLIKDEYGCCPVSIKKEGQFSIETKPYNSQGKESVWRWGKQKSQENIVNNDPVESQIVAKQKTDGNWNIYEKNRRSTTKVKSVWAETEMRTENGTRLIRELFDITPFDHPKSIGLMKRCIKIGSSEGIIVDLFAGSCTTANAIMDLNAEDGGARKYIMVQLPEPCDEKSEAYKAGYKTIADIGKERIRRAGEKIKAENKGKLDFDGGKLDLGFKVFKLDESNFKQWRETIKTGEELKEQMEMFVDNKKKGSAPEDMLYEIILKNSRFDLNVKLEKKTFDGIEYYNLTDGEEIICLADKITKKLAEKILKEKPQKFTCLDTAFKNNDQLKTNTALQMEAEKIEFKVI